MPYDPDLNRMNSLGAVEPAPAVHLKLVRQKHPKFVIQSQRSNSEFVGKASQPGN
jgi:hypothetical protein